MENCRPISANPRYPLHTGKRYHQDHSEDVVASQADPEIGEGFVPRVVCLLAPRLVEARSKNACPNLRLNYDDDAAGPAAGTVVRMRSWMRAVVSMSWVPSIRISGSTIGTYAMETRSC